MKLRIGPATKDLTEDQEYQETQEFYEEPPGSHPSLLLSPIDIACKICYRFTYCWVNLHDQFIYLLLDHLLCHYMVERTWVYWIWVRYWDIFLVWVGCYIFMRRGWKGLYRGSEQLNSIIDQGLGACVGHAPRVSMAGTSVPVGGTDPSGSVVV